MIAAARPDLRQLDVFGDLGLRELLAGGAQRHEALLEIRVRACREIGVTHAAVPPEFPLETAEALRAAGIELYVDRALFEDAPAAQERGRAGGHPPRHPGRRAGARRGRRCAAHATRA